MENETFTRIFEIENKNKILTLYQQQIGDVGCVVWDAALVLAKFLISSCSNKKFGENWLEGKKVLELGAGVGCVGMTAACLGAHVVMTDLETNIPILEKNIAANESQWKDIGTATAKIFDWKMDVDSNFTADVILLSDCVYYMESVEPLIKTLESLCKLKPDTYTILSQERRDTPQQITVWNEFLNKLSKKFELKYIPLNQQHELYCSEDIYLIELNKLS